MENDQFDWLSRAIGAGASRRQVLKLLAGGMLLPILGIAPSEDRVAASMQTKNLWAKAFANTEKGWCGAFDAGSADEVRNGSPQEMAQFKQMVDNLSASPNKKTINVAFHLILVDNGLGQATDAQIAAQIDVLSRAYVRAGLQFRLVQLDRTTNNDWFKLYLNSNEERAMMKALAVDPAHTLNIYSCLPQGLLGWARFPWDTKNEGGFMNAVVVQTGTLPGVFIAPTNPYDQGLVAVHELGHYLGLFHTFQGGCAEPGDYCDDTPAEAKPVYDCETGLDTCPSNGVDPVHNYMDYTVDACKNQFTRDQAARMLWALATYRPSLTLG